jgi:hypothetical protein
VVLRLDVTRTTKHCASPDQDKGAKADLRRGEIKRDHEEDRKGGGSGRRGPLEERRKKRDKLESTWGYKRKVGRWRGKEPHLSYPLPSSSSFHAHILPPSRPSGELVEKSVGRE